MFTQANCEAPEQLEEWRAWLRLSLTPSVGNDGARRLLAAFGLPQHIFNQPLSALCQVVSERQAQALRQVPEGFEQLAQTTLNWLLHRLAADAKDAGETSPQQRKPERGMLSLGDALYPASLLQTSDPPFLLYVMGAQLEHKLAQHLADTPEHSPHRPHAVAMVGSRNPSNYGLENAQRFAKNLVEQGWLVVSGLALGIDTAAHQGALQAAQDASALSACGATWAVVGTGLDRVYPSRNLSLARSIAAQGLLISEYPLGTPPLAHHFPQRNRIIAGLSAGVLVVEAAVESGSLITARAALEQGREVLAIPGSIHSPQSKGCHSLLRQGAKLVESAQDVLEELEGLAGSSPLKTQTGGTLASSKGDSSAKTRPSMAEPLAERVFAETNDPVLQAMGHEPVGFDALQARCGMATADLQSKLLELELAGELQQLPGGLYGRSYRP
jgi:DNA processing protein